MEFYEIEALIDNMWRKSKDSWEQARIQAYITAQVNSPKKIEMSDILTFPWEKDVKVEDTQEDKEALMKEIKEWEKIMNKKE